MEFHTAGRFSKYSACNLVKKQFPEALSQLPRKLQVHTGLLRFSDSLFCSYLTGKEPEDLTDYESTLLAGVPNAPSKYAPTVNLELAEKRQEQVVERLVACGLFTKERALETLAGSEKKG